MPPWTVGRDQAPLEKLLFVVQGVRSTPVQVLPFCFSSSTDLPLWALIYQLPQS